MAQPEKLQKHLDAWKEKHLSKGYQRFIRDGIVNPSVWSMQQTPKICYLLKEAYTEEPDGYDMTEWLHENRQNPYKMWKRVAVWTWAIHNAFTGALAYDHSVIEKNYGELTDSIAVVNIKKSDGKSSSDWQDLQTYAQSDRKEIKKELELIAPDIIVCGNVFQLLKNEVLGDMMDCPNIGDSMYGFWNGRLVIDYYHPANHYPNSVNYYALMSICKCAIQDGFDFRAPFPVLKVLPSSEVRRHIPSEIHPIR